MEAIYQKARAKINLNLKVLEKREDGYHNIESIFQKISLYDEIFIEKNNEEKINIHSNYMFLNGEKNIIYQAYQALKERFPNIKGVTVKLNKKIPTQAGLGGGSTDCASFLWGMNQLFHFKLSIQELMDIGKKLGADVPSCFFKSAMRVEGIGEKITPILVKKSYYVIIVKPHVSFKTKEMYQKIDKQNERSKETRTEELEETLRQGNIKEMIKYMENDFEKVISHKSLIQNIKNRIMGKGAIGTLMTGSGSCIYGIFEDKMMAKKAYRELDKKYHTIFSIAQATK